MRSVTYNHSVKAVLDTIHSYAICGLKNRERWHQRRVRHIRTITTMEPKWLTTLATRARNFRAKIPS